MTPKDNVNVTALTAGVTGLVATIGALGATGLLGRLERNEPGALTAAVIVVLLGALMLVIAGCPVTTGRSELFATLVGAGLTVVGIGWAAAAAIDAAGTRERPEMEMAVSDDGSLLEGTVKAANLASERRLAVRVDGLTRTGDKDRYWNVFTIAQYYVGPDGDGKIDMSVKALIPPDGFDSVGVQASTDDEQEACDKYPGRLVGSTVKNAGTGCVVLSLPQKEEASAPASPNVALSWVGEGRTRARLKVTKVGSSGRLLVLVAGRRGGQVRQLLRTLAAPPASGVYRTTVRVDPAFTRICARARVISAKGKAPKRLRRCPIARALVSGTAGDELRG